METSSAAAHAATSSRAEAARKRFVGAARAAATHNADSALAANSSSAENGSISIEDMQKSLALVQVEQSKTVHDQSQPRIGKSSNDRTSLPSQDTRIASQIPLELLGDQLLNESIRQLPENYNFEIHKTVWQIRCSQAKRVALQFPEGLLMYSLTIADIIERFTQAETIVMGDVTYGACCVDDYTAKALGCDFMVHYGHSCLVPITTTALKTLYIFVEISIDTAHLLDTVLAQFPSPGDIAGGLVLVATVQFIATLHALRIDLLKRGYTNVIVPQSRPLSPGEVLGCTAPSILSTPNTTSNTAPSPLPVLLYVGDGRFHLEAIMIANPRSPAYRYDPYAKAFTRETYDHAMMRELRALAIRRAAGDTRRDCNQGDGACGRRFGLILGTLGRQGSRKVAEHLKRLITGELYEQQEGSNTKDTLANTSASTNTTRMEDPVRSNSTRSSVLTVLMSEITPEKLRAFGDCFDAWVQTSCPRLSIDWGHAFDKPLLSPYEAAVCVGGARAPWIEKRKVEEGEVYPMDFYSKASGGAWTPNYQYRAAK